MLNIFDPYAKAVSEYKQQQRLRQLRQIGILTQGRILVDGIELVNLASNDYLGLSQHPKLKERAIEFIQKYGVGSPSSRLLSGNLECYETIENKLAALKGTETALILASGFQTNSTVLAALGQKGVLLGSDRLNHNSIVQGLISSQSAWFRYKHNDIGDLDLKLAKKAANQYSCKWLISESVFSMDGDIADLEGLRNTASRYGAGLYVDEAHATGVLGRNGMGLTAQNKLADISMGTFGKGLGSFGSYVACSHIIRDFLINRCPGLIYSTALPPPVLGAIDGALDLIPAMENERSRLLTNAMDLRNRIKALGFDCADSDTQIIPIVIGKEETALSLSRSLEKQGFYVPAIRPPTVPEGTARVRISLTLDQTKEQLSALIEALKSWHEKKD